MNTTLRSFKAVLSSFVVFLICNSIFGQSFQNVALDVGIEVYSQFPDYGNGISFVDYNHDGWDDLTFCRNGEAILRFQNINGSFIADDSIPNNLDAKHVSYVDLMNDGNYEILVTGHFGSLKLYEEIDDVWTDITESSNLTTPDTERTYGAAWGDYDKDGDLDCYVCNYSASIGATNWFFENNGDLTFTERAVELGIDNGLKHSFQATWLDYDNDGWSDIYVINDKLSPNALFHNLGNGTFEDVSASLNADVVLDAMTNTVGDYDHDGDLDIYMSDDGEGNFLLRNDGSTFTNVAPELNLDLAGFNWGAQWLDYENDSNLDLYISNITPIAESLNYLFIQDDAGVFTTSPQYFIGLDQMPAYSNAIGDFDNDGFIDIVVNCENDFPAALWQNTPNDNHFMKINLEGQLSNIDGIGSWIHCYFNGNHEVKYTLSGESYLAQNSFCKIFGLSSAEMVDSLIIEWPSGHIDYYYDLEANQTLHLIEGSSLSLNWPLDTVYLCSGDSLFFEFEGFDSYIWSNGSTSNSVYITEPGIYTLTAFTDLGIEVQSDSLTVLIAQPTQFNVLASDPTCYGLSDGNISIPGMNTLGLSAIWTIENDTVSPINLHAGVYTGLIIDSLGCSSEYQISLLDPDPLNWEMNVQDVICFGESSGSIDIVISGGHPPYTFDIPNDGINLAEGEYWWYVEDANTCQDSAMFTIESNPEISAEIMINPDVPLNDSVTVTVIPNGGSPPFEITWDNGESEFELILPPGFHTFTLIDQLGCTWEGTVDLPTSITEKPHEQILLYPNPTSDHVCIKNLGRTDLIVTITDLTGRIVWQKTQTSTMGMLEVNLNGLSPGTYLVKILNSSGNLTFSSKMLVQN